MKGNNNKKAIIIVEVSFCFSFYATITEDLLEQKKII